MPRLTRTALACLALALGCALAAGCGSSDKTDSGSAKTAATPAPPSSTTTTKKTTTTPESTGGTSPSKTVAVVMQNIKFVPDKISVKVGEKIKWTNNDGFAHNVTSTGGEKISSGNIDGGASYEFTPTEAGTILYTCTLHQNQNGTITVTK